MQDIQTIYRQTILPLAVSERLRLATIILQGLTNGEGSTQSALELLEALPKGRVFESPEDVDQHLKTERESWDN